MSLVVAVGLLPGCIVCVLGGRVEVEVSSGGRIAER
jgi:hypothetical protein